MFLSALSAACGQHIRFPERLKNLRKNFILQYPEYLSVGVAYPLLFFQVLTI